MSEKVYHKRSSEVKPGRLLSGQARMEIAGGVVTVTASTQMGRDARAVRFDADHYVVLATGEVIAMEHTAESRADHMDSLRRSMVTLRGLINSNFGSGAPLPSQAWLTLTYRECVRDTARVQTDFEAFIRWLRARVRARVEYIAVIEPQRRGAWHLHVLLLRPDGEAFYVPQSEMLAAWRGIAARMTPPELLSPGEDGRARHAGGVHIHRLDDAGDNLGAYLSAYLCDEDGSKGARLSLYPPGVQYYRCSRGIKRPEVRRYATLSAAMQDAREITGSEAHYDDSYVIEAEDGTQVQAGARLQYKRRKT